MQPLTDDFQTVYTLGELATALADSLNAGNQPLPWPEPAAGPLPAKRLAARAAAYRGSRSPTLVVTSRTITATHTSALFGYADRRRRVVLVSVARLEWEIDRVRAMSRFANVLAHERGHLAGLGHCRTPGCLMVPARSAEELDGRRTLACGRCPRVNAGRRRLAGGLALVTASALVFSGLDAVARSLKPEPHRPFACASAPGFTGARLYFKARPVIERAAAGGVAPLSCATPQAADALNRLFQLVRQPAALQVVEDARGNALVRAGAALVLAVPGRGTGAEPPTALARRWADDLEILLRAKGWPNDGCPECHAERPIDMRNAAR